MAQAEVVVVQQPESDNKPFRQENVRPWSTGLCGCFEACCSCMYACFCFPCFSCGVASRMGECACGPFCFGCLFLAAMRTKLRTMYRIKGSVLDDVCMMTCCGFCATHQMHREMNKILSHQPDNDSKEDSKSH